jgi:pyruvate kinase
LSIHLERNVRDPLISDFSLITRNGDYAIIYVRTWVRTFMKYIAVVNPRMDDDDISRLIAKNIAGALFQISHQNFALASKLIEQVKKLSKRHQRPVSIIQDLSGMEDPLELEFGVKSGADWVVTDQVAHAKLAKGLNKLSHVIFKGRNLPKDIRIDSVMADSFVDPDAEVMGKSAGQIKHIIQPHENQAILDSVLDIAHHAGCSAVAVSDLNMAKSLSFRRPDKKIIYAPDNHDHARRAAIYKSVHPIFMGNDLVSSLRNSQMMKRGDRVADATDTKHVVIHLIP